MLSISEKNVVVVRDTDLVMLGLDLLNDLHLI